MGWVVHIACNGEVIGAYWVLIGNSEGKSQLRRPRHRWEDNAF
jgi:hypothetical protein